MTSDERSLEEVEPFNSNSGASGGIEKDNTK